MIKFFKQKIKTLISKNLIFFQNIFKNNDAIKYKKIFFHYKNQKACYGLIEEIFFQEIYSFKTNKKNPLIIDAGSNIGISVLYFKSLYPAARIMAFEPEQDTFNILKKNILKNNLRNVRLYNCALADSQGRRLLFQDASNTNFVGMSLNRRLAKKGFPLRQKYVECKKLSNFIKNKVDLLKIDVEGLEDKILKEIQTTGRIKFIKNLIIEFHQDADLSENKFTTIIQILEKFKFKIGFTKHTGFPFSTHKWPTNFILYATKV